MMIAPWTAHELGKIRMERALAECEQACELRRVRSRERSRRGWGVVLGIAGAIVVIHEALKALFTARRKATGL